MFRTSRSSCHVLPAPGPISPPVPAAPRAPGRGHCPRPGSASPLGRRQTLPSLFSSSGSVVPSVPFVARPLPHTVGSARSVFPAVAPSSPSMTAGRATRASRLPSTLALGCPRLPPPLPGFPPPPTLAPASDYALDLSTFLQRRASQLPCGCLGTPASLRLPWCESPSRGFLPGPGESGPRLPGWRWEEVWRGESPGVSLPGVEIDPAGERGSSWRM